ncbi:hypothetical protein E2C06_16680 [Dankookia rubra]|uniref:Glycosyltransferase RgtA/B/C/D-like domain-containing protein n=1 Tax=Dankookia rubra TaxID=1442381 RepID=A0A4R5QE00_9PROT|nr:hypothetical protein [Dankookia rubra]TDH61422.1 hypothetical protein E2C06_16680 [Dankookia rubra]
MLGNRTPSTLPRLLPIILLGGLILGWPAYWNGYPLVFNDTGNYIAQVKLRFIGWTAPPFYSAFLSGTDLGLTLWGPVLAQGLVAATVVVIALEQSGLRRRWGMLLAFVALAGLTSLPWLASQVTADFFTGIAVLSLALLAFGRPVPWHRWVLPPVALLAILAHQSHVPLALGMVAAAGAIGWARGGRRAALAILRRMAPAPVLALAIAFAVNLFGLGIPAISPFGNIILAARMLADGTALDYLQEACPAQHYRLCDHLAEIPPGGTVFLWDRPAMWDAIGGHRAWNAEASRIVRGTIAHDPAGVLRDLLANGAAQFAALRTGESILPWPKDDGPRPMIARFFPAELQAFDHSRQQRGLLLADVRPFERLHVPIAWLGIAGLLACILVWRRDPLVPGLCALVLLAAMGNALLTGGLSEVQNRYAARLAWVLVLTPCLVLAARLPEGAPGRLPGAATRAG